MVMLVYQRVIETGNHGFLLNERCCLFSEIFPEKARLGHEASNSKAINHAPRPGMGGKIIPPWASPSTAGGLLTSVRLLTLKSYQKRDGCGSKPKGLGAGPQVFVMSNNHVLYNHHNPFQLLTQAICFRKKWIPKDVTKMSSLQLWHLAR